MADRGRALEGLELKSLFGGRYQGRRVLVTGHTGFKGSWLALWLRALGAEVGGFALAPDTHPSHWNLLGLTLDFEVRADLRDPRAVHEAVAAFGPDVVFHLAAQPLVRRSYREPVETFTSNIGGLVHLLEAVRACGSVRVVVNATTDKVYEAHPGPVAFREGDPLGGHDPYSTSKACAELVSSSYRRSYFDRDDGRGWPVRLATARAGNVIGGGDWAEDRLVPDLVRSLSGSAPVRIRNLRATRPWQHVLEPLSGYLRIGQALLDDEVGPEAWNLGPVSSDTLAVGDIVARLQSHWPRLRVEEDTAPHPHEAPFLALDCRKAEHELGWRPTWNADTALLCTARWYGAFLDEGRVLTHDDLSAYVHDAREAGAGWTA